MFGENRKIYKCDKTSVHSEDSAPNECIIISQYRQEDNAVMLFTEKMNANLRGANVASLHHMSLKKAMGLRACFCPLTKHQKIDLLLNLEDKNEPSMTTVASVKKRKGDLDKDNMKPKQVAKKRKETAKDRLLKLNRFYISNRFGIWIQCTKCNKWRNVIEYEEEHEVPDDWCCAMSSSGTRRCDEPENTENVEFSPVNFIPGTIVWAKYNGYPWWPGMIEDDPDVEEYYWIEKNGKISYNITFLDDKVTHAWVSSTFVRHFLDQPRLKYQPREHAKYSPWLAAAEIKAREAMKMSIQERLQKFSFAQLYKGRWGSPLPSDDSDEEEKDLTQMLLEEMDDIESVKSADSDYKSVSSSELKKDGTNNKFNDCEISSKGNAEREKNRVNRNKLIDTQSKKESELTNDDNAAHFKEKVNEKANLLNELIDEVVYLDESLPDTTETPVLSKGKCSYSKLKNEKITKANKDVVSSEKIEKDIKDGSKNEKTLMKKSKAKNKKADKFQNLNTKEHQDQREPSILIKHTADATVMNEIKKQNCKEKTLNNSSNSKFKPPVKNKTISHENNQNSKSIDSKKIATNVNNLGSAIEEENLVKKEISERNLEKKHLDKTSVTEEKAFNNVENNRSLKEDVKCENNLKGNNIAETLEKYLKNSLESQPISMQENKNCTSYNSKGTLNAENNKDNKKQKKKVYKNFDEDLVNSDIPDNKGNCNTRIRSIAIHKKKNLKVDSSTEDLSVSNAGSSELTDTFKNSGRQNASKKEKKEKKCFKYEIKNDYEKVKQKQEHEVIFASDKMLKDISCNENSNEEIFSLSLKMNSQESEDSDPFEA